MTLTLLLVSTLTIREVRSVTLFFLNFAFFATRMDSRLFLGGSFCSRWCPSPVTPFTWGNWGALTLFRCVFSPGSLFYEFMLVSNIYTIGLGVRGVNQNMMQRTLLSLRISTSLSRLFLGALDLSSP